ncbi:hypothetical protein HK098_006399 [Nowakowskiella sp. JEL0407]|nr:hypothetical protein HK098_006399 [Nowakowskiella sp. JEL0407]
MSKTALVTGSSRGIGRGIALRLAADNHNIVVNYQNNKSAADELVAQIESQYKVKAIAVKADTSDLTQAKELADFGLKTFEKIDVLVLNAAIADNIAFENITPDDYDRIFGVNVKGPLFLTQYLAPHMNSGSRVIFISSVVTSWSGVYPKVLLYTATKGAVEQLVRLLAKDLGRKGITVNAVSPGPVITDMFRSVISTEEQLTAFTAIVPLGRIGQPEDIAEVVRFLASKEGGWINGQNIRADGGTVV